MKAATLTFALLLTPHPMLADFSYTITRTTTAGASVAGNDNNGSWKYSIKGQKMRIDRRETALILDFDAKTITTIDDKQKVFAARDFSSMLLTPADAVPKIDVKETGRSRMILGQDAAELILTIELDSPELQTMGSGVQMEMELWLARGLLGGGGLHTFYQKNRDQIPWFALAGTGNQAIQSGLAGLQRRITELNGVPLLELVRVKPLPVAAKPELTPAESTRIRDRIAELDSSIQKGSPDRIEATKELARLKAMVGDDFLAGGGPTGTLFEITMEATGFSSAPIPNSVFAIPAAYRQIDQKEFDKKMNAVGSVNR